MNTRCAGAYKLHARHLTDVKQEMIVMHPLPRVDEIDPSVDRLVTHATLNRLSTV